MSLAEFRLVAQKVLMKSDSWRVWPTREPRTWTRPIVATRSTQRVLELPVAHHTATTAMPSPSLGQRVE